MLKGVSQVGDTAPYSSYEGLVDQWIYTDPPTTKDSWGPFFVVAVYKSNIPRGWKYMFDMEHPRKYVSADGHSFNQIGAVGGVFSAYEYITPGSPKYYLGSRFTENEFWSPLDVGMVRTYSIDHTGSATGIIMEMATELGLV